MVRIAPGYLLLALANAFAAFALAVNHPLWPMAMLAFLWCVMVLEAFRPGSWLFLVPACLPLLNFSPWTGWIVFEEWDVLLLGMLAGGYVRLAFAAEPVQIQESRPGKWFNAVWWALVAMGLVALLRGVSDAGGWAFDWFAGYDHALNSLRVFKSMAYATLLWPLLRVQTVSSDQQARVQQRFALGMVLGLLVVCVTVLWERAGFVGLRDFSSNYRTVALFWEMHVGGAAIDAYLAMSAPFAVWAMLSAKRPLPWFAGACLVLVLGYACLTTFSRGVYLAVLAPQLLLAHLLYSRAAAQRRDRIRWRLVGGFVVVALLSTEVVAVLGGGSFMSARIAKSGEDMGSRLAHWQRGIELLQSPSDGWTGIGLGRFPARYSAHAEGENFPGTIELGVEHKAGLEANPFVRLTRPLNGEDLPGIYALTQRVDAVPGNAPRLQLDVRSEVAAALVVQVCERHLLYDGACKGTVLHVKPTNGAWQTIDLPLKGPPLDASRRLLTFALDLESPGASVDVDHLQLKDGRGQNMLRNADFSQNLAQWLPSAQSYFVPWHVDNLYLEWLVERGGVGLILFCLLVGLLFWPQLLQPTLGGKLSPYIAAGLAGGLVVGLVSSVMDVPRVALLMLLLMLLHKESDCKR